MSWIDIKLMRSYGVRLESTLGYKPRGWCSPWECCYSFWKPFLI